MIGEEAMTGEDIVHTIPTDQQLQSKSKRAAAMNTMVDLQEMGSEMILSLRHSLTLSKAFRNF